MKALLTRMNASSISRWWWTVDRLYLAFIITLVVIGGVMMMAGTPLIARKLHLPPLYFVEKHVMIIIPSIIIMIGVSLLSVEDINKIAIFTLISSIVLMVIAAFWGMEIKGAKRWLSLMGFSLQPSEFMKPAFAVVMGIVLSRKNYNADFPVKLVAIGIYLITVISLYLQPDMGMIILITVTWFGQCFLAGLPIIYVVVLISSGLIGLGGAYFLLPHVASRIDRFLDPQSGDTYQITRSLEAFMKGGFLGVGPGEGIVKKHLPDAHADFIFAVMGEEFGVISCIVLVSIFTFLLLRGCFLILRENNLSIILGAAGILAQFTLQALINMCSALHLVPTKGMTLPFISYGGSSCWALSLGIGMFMGITRVKIGQSRRI